MKIVYDDQMRVVPLSIRNGNAAGHGGGGAGKGKALMGRDGRILKWSRVGTKIEL